MNWFQIGKGVCQALYYLSAFMRSTFMQSTSCEMDEAQAEIKLARRNINNLRYADDTTLMAESKELKSLLMKLKEESEKLA